MTLKSDIPREPLDIRFTSTGSMPLVWLHRRGRVFRQESSYTHIWLVGVMLLAAVGVSFIPWSERGLGGLKVKYFIAFGLVWGGICTVAGYFIRNALGQTIIVDPVAMTLRIKKHIMEQTIQWRDIVGLQVCRRVVSRYSQMNGYQLNLVWTDEAATVRRHCLLQDRSKHMVTSLGERYQELFGFELLDHAADE